MSSVESDPAGRSGVLMCGPLLLVAWPLAFVACGGVSPDPVRMATDLPPVREVVGVPAQRLERAEERAWGALERGDLHVARRESDVAIGIDPRSAIGRVVRGLLLLADAQKEDPPELRTMRRAEGELRSARALAPNDLRVGFGLIRLLEADGHLAAAAAEADTLLEQHPEDPRLLSVAGRLHDDLGNETLSVDLLERYVEQKPEDAGAWYRLAWSRARLGERARDEPERAALWRAAAEAFESYVALITKDADGYLGAGHAWLQVAGLVPAERSTALAAALASYAKVEELLPEAASGPYGAGAVHEAAGRIEAASVAYDRALAREPNHVPSLLNQLALQQTKNPPRAEALARKLLALPADALTGGERKQIEAWLARREEPVDASSDVGDGN